MSLSLPGVGFRLLRSYSILAFCWDAAEVRIGKDSHLHEGAGMRGILAAAVSPEIALGNAVPGHCRAASPLEHPGPESPIVGTMGHVHAARLGPWRLHRLHGLDTPDLEAVGSRRNPPPAPFSCMSPALAEHLRDPVAS